MWRMKPPRSVRVPQLPQTPPAPPPGRGSAPAPHCPWETSIVRHRGSEPAKTQCRRRAPGSRPQPPVRIRTICEVATVARIWQMADSSDPPTPRSNPTFADSSRLNALQQIARRHPRLPRTQLGSGSLESRHRPCRARRNPPTYLRLATPRRQYSYSVGRNRHQEHPLENMRCLRWSGILGLLPATGTDGAPRPAPSGGYFEF
jgi:hypothetical protein